MWLYPSSTGGAPYEAAASAVRYSDKVMHGFDGAMIIQIVMSAFGKTHELFRIVGEREQPLTQIDRYLGIPPAVHDQKRHPDAGHAPVGIKRVLDQPAYRYEGQFGGSDIRDRGVRRFEDEFADRMVCRQRDGDPAAERKAPEHDPLRAISRRRERMSRFGIEQKPLLARSPGRTTIAAIRQRDEPCPVLRDVTKAADEPRQEIPVAVKKQHDR